MPRYFFDVDDGVELRDEIGQSLDGEADARLAALRTAAQTMSAEADKGREATLVIAVRDESGATPLKVRLACLVEPQ